jgi:tetratricopeptide (TPR) repeat protein
LEDRFNHTGSTDDVNQAIAIYEKAIELTPDDHPKRPLRLCNFGNALVSSFERNGESREALDRAVLAYEEAVSSTPVDHPSRPQFLTGLSIALQEVHSLTKSLSVLQQAIERNEQAVSSTPDGPDRVIYLNNLGVSLMGRFEATTSRPDLDRAISTYEEAVALMPNDQPNNSIYLRNLGNAFQSRFKLTNSVDDYEGAVSSFERAVDVSAGLTSFRIAAAHDVASLLVGRDIPRAEPLLRKGVELLALITPRYLKDSDRQYNISHFAGLTSRAASAALECGKDPYEALQILELGRGVIATLQLQIRSDTSHLKDLHPDIAKEFDDLRTILDGHQNHGDQVQPNIKSNNEPYRALVTRFDALLKSIRGLPGFDRFLLGLSKDQLHQLAEKGPLIIINVSDIRSDALIVESQKIRILPLPLLKHADLERYSLQHFNATTSVSLRTQATSRLEVKAVLEWLWDVGISQILAELKYVETPAENDIWPRVWWTGCNLMNLLPIHAAGYHDSHVPQSVIDRVISSYAPTLKTLWYATERNLRVNLESQRALIIGMAQTPEHADLRSVEVEIQHLQRLFANDIQTTVLQLPTRDAVLSILADQQIVHLCCHGYSSAEDPSQSKLLLTDWQTAPLTVSILTALNLRSPQLAYLSACHTSVVRDHKLLDESINISSAVQLAGFPSVVGTAWHVTDKRSPEVAEAVYSWILKDGRLDFARSAEGLHRSVRVLREKTRSSLSRGLSDPLVWASYIHVGI